MGAFSEMQLRTRGEGVGDLRQESSGVGHDGSGGGGKFDRVVDAIGGVMGAGGFARGRCIVEGHTYPDRGCWVKETEDGDYIAGCDAECPPRDVRAAIEARLLELGDEPVDAVERKSPEDLAIELELKRKRQQAKVRHLLDGARPIGPEIADYLRGRGLLDPILYATALEYEPIGGDDCYRYFRDFGPANMVRLMLFRLTHFETDECDSLHATIFARAMVKTGRRSVGPNGGRRAIKLCGRGIPSLLVVGEGIESAASAQQLGYGPAWALGSAGGLGRFPVLPEVQHLIIAAENDEASEKNVSECTTRWKRAGKRVQIVRPPRGSKDLNDWIRKRSWTK